MIDMLPGTSLRLTSFGVPGFLLRVNRISVFVLLRSRLREKCKRHKHPAAGCLDSHRVSNVLRCPDNGVWMLICRFVALSHLSPLFNKNIMYPLKRDNSGTCRLSAHQSSRFEPAISIRFTYKRFLGPLPLIRSL